MQEIIFELLGINSKMKTGLNPEVRRQLKKRELILEFEFSRE